MTNLNKLMSLCLPIYSFLSSTNDFEDIDKLKNTLLRYARAMKIAGDPSAERKEYAKKLYKLIAPGQQDPALALFSRFSAGELTGKELKSQWAELSLLKDRPKPGEDREWEAVDTYADEVLATVRDYSRTNATNYFRDTLGNAYSFRVREKEPETVSARAKLAKRIKTPKEKDDQQDSENLQARISADVANVQRRWEFYRAETGAVIDTVDDINMMQANAVRADIVRRYGHPDESVRMRSVPTEQSAERARANMDRSSGSLLQGAVRAQDNMDAFERNSDRIDAIRAQARLGQARPAFGDVADVEPDVAQNFPAGTQRNIGGSLAWELYNRETGETVRTFWQPNEAEASRYAQEYVRDVLGSGSYSIRPQMTTNESQDIQEGQFATLEQLKQYFRKIGRSEAEAAAAWQRGYRGQVTPAVPRTPPVKHWQDINEDAMMGKIESTGKIVRIIRKQHSVKFSDQKDWLLIDTDPEKGDKGAGLKWVPASTRFEWVRPYRETIDEGYYQVPDNNIFPDGNLFLTGHAKNDRFPERDITTDRVINLCRQAGKQYPNKLANLGDTGLVIQDPDEFGVGLIKQELPNGRYRYIVKTARDNLRTGVEEPVFKVIDENFADGKGPGRPGDSQRHGIPKGATMAQLEKAAKAPGRKGQLARWQINMRRGKKK